MVRGLRYTGLFAVVVLVLGSILLFVSPSGAATSDIGLYKGTETPTAYISDAPVELGVRFTVSQPGTIYSIRFNESTKDTGAHTGALWSSNGTRLATVNYSGAKVGWRQSALSTAVHVVPGVTYTASYHSVDGYNYQRNAFPLSSNQYMTGTGGVYHYGTTGFPNSNSVQGTAYYVDPLFKPDTATTTPTTTSTPTTTVSPTTVPTTTTAPTPTTAPSTTTPPTGYPDASNTGTHGTLTKYTGPLNITAAGTTVANVEIDGCVTIGASANNVTFNNVLFKSNGCYWLLLNTDGAKNTVVTDSEFDGLNNSSGDAAFAGYNFTFNRVNIHGTVDGGKLGSNDIIQDSYIHDLVITSDSHNDGLQSLGSDNVKIQHNTIIVKNGATSAIILSTGAADSIHNVAIDNNLFAGGAYTVYGGYEQGVDTLSKVGNITITNNEFSTQIFANGGYYGPLTSDDAPAVTVSGNRWYDGSKAGQLLPGQSTEPSSPPATTITPTTVPPSTTTPPATTITPTTAPSTTTPPQSGFPSSSNTGVPAGTALTAYAGSCNLAAGTVIDSKILNCDVEIMGANVKITRSQINGIVQSDHSDTGRGTASVSITDSDINGGNQEEFPTVSYDSVTLLRDEVVGGQHSVQCNSNCSITDSYLHGQYLPTSSAGHVNAFISNGGSGFTLEHDTLWCSVNQTPNDGGCSGDVGLFGDFAPIANVTINNSLLYATHGSACIFGGHEPSKQYPNPSNVKITNNTFQRGTYPGDKGQFSCGYYFPITSEDKDIVTGNKFDDGTPVS